VNHKRKIFRSLINGPKLLIVPGAYDALSARLIQSQGFSAIVAGGYAAVGSLLGQPDLGQSNMRDLVDHYSRICDAVEIPVYVDLDTGFGGVHNVYQAVKALEKAGAAGIFLNDQVYPNRCNYLPGKAVISLNEFMGKVNAALDARTDPDLFVCARTDVYSIDGIHAAIERCQQFMSAGVDMAKPQGVDTLEEIQQVKREVTGPHFATLSQASGLSGLSFEMLQSAGVNAVTLPSLTLFAAAQSVQNILIALKSAHGVKELSSQLISLNDYYTVTGLDALNQKEFEYLKDIKS
jgi:methylisocitrate lyase